METLLQVGKHLLGYAALFAVIAGTLWVLRRKGIIHLPAAQRSPTIHLNIEVSRKLFEEFELFIRQTGCKDQRELFAAMVSMNRWTIEHFDKGYIIAAIDPHGKSYAQLDVRKAFPNFAQTSNQELN